MTDDCKKFYKRVPLEWTPRTDVMNDPRDGRQWPGFQLSLNWCLKRKLVELKFVDGIQYIRRVALEELM